MLRAAGYRVTPQRIAVFEELRASSDHPSADALFRRVRRRHPAVSRAAVYKTLQVLASLGLAAQFQGTDGAARFDGDPAPHLNMVCVRCGAIEDLVGIDAAPLIRRAARISGFRVEGHLTVRGICPRCRRRSNQRKVVRNGSAGTSGRRGQRR